MIRSMIAFSYNDRKHQKWPENGFRPNERIPKKSDLKRFSERISNEKTRIPENPNEQYLFTNFSELSFASGKHNLLVHVTEKLLLKVFVLHKGCTSSYQVTGNTENSY